MQSAEELRQKNRPPPELSSIAKCVQVDLSCVLLEVSNHISSVLGVGDTGESHGITWSVIGWGLEIFVEITVSPLLALESLESAGVSKSILGGWIRSIGSLEEWTSVVRLEVVADSAQVLESLLSLGGVSSLLLLWCHYVVEFVYFFR